MPFTNASPKRDKKKAVGATADHRTSQTKAGLKGVGFAAGAAALAPPAPGPAAPARPVAATPPKRNAPPPVAQNPLPPAAQGVLPPIAQDVPAPAPLPAPAPAAQPAGGGRGIFADDVAPAPAAQPAGGSRGIFADDVAPAAPAGPKLTAEEIEEQRIAAATTQWCDPTLDDRDQVEVCVKKSATPANIGTHLGNADSAMKQIKANPKEYERHAKTMSEDDMRMVALYTTQAAYAINAILRGLIKSKPWIDTFGSYAERITKALAKVPKGARNTQAKATLDPKKKDNAIVSFDKVYRNDDWNPVFEKVFADEYQEGRVLEDPAFFSATMIKDSYKPSAPVKRTIEDVTLARSITSLSGVTEEREALFPPGLKLKIVGIEREDRRTKQRTPVGAPGAAYPIGGAKAEDAFNNGGRWVWHIRLKQVGPPPAPDAKKEAPKKDKAGKPPAPEPSKSSFLEKLLGVGYTVD